jgi:hypothetical protein
VLPLDQVKPIGENEPAVPAELDRYADAGPAHSSRTRRAGAVRHQRRQRGAFGFPVCRRSHGSGVMRAIGSLFAALLGLGGRRPSLTSATHCRGRA